MVMNGAFLAGHRKGFDDGVAAGWEAGYLRAMQDTGAAPVGPVPEPSGVDYVPPVASLAVTVKDLYHEGRLTLRAYNCLDNDGILTIGDLADATEPRLWELRNLGQKTLDEIKALLASMGLALKDDSGEEAANV